MSNATDLGEPDVDNGEMDLNLNGKEQDSVKIRLESDFDDTDALLKDIHACPNCDVIPVADGHSRLCDEHLIEEFALAKVMLVQQTNNPDNPNIEAHEEAMRERDRADSRLFMAMLALVAIVVVVAVVL